VQPGDVVAGRYRIEAVLGRGGMAGVYRAHDSVLERDVALKVLDPKLSDDDEHVERFRREARAIAALSHPNLVTVIDRGEVDECEFIVFELVRGANLKELLHERRVLAVQDALGLTRQAARGLGYAHAHGVVHRDVKPQNVLVDELGTAKVTDFGIARLVESDGAITQSGTILGTSDYLSPEQATGKVVDERADQYSLGVLLFELLTGEVPYEGDSAVTVALKHVHDPIPSVRTRRPETPQRVDDLVRTAMAKRPEERFPTLEEMIGEIDACLAEVGEPEEFVDRTEIIAPTAPPRDANGARPPGRRRRGIPWQLLAGLLVLGAGVLAVWALATGRFDPAGGDGGGEASGVELRAVRDWDPEGDGVEHPERVPQATDGNPTTAWTTESYRNFSETKPGVGIVLDAGNRVELGGIVVTSEAPGFTAVIQAGNRSEGPFENVSEEQVVEERTTFDLDTAERPFRFYVLWITALEDRALVNEVQAE
jgi:serine/threonine-protein kinase